MNRIILLCLFALMTFQARGDTSVTGGGRVIENPTNGGSISLRVNNGGTKIDPVTMSSAGALTLGSSASLQTHSLNGYMSLVTDGGTIRLKGSSTTANNATLGFADENNSFTNGHGVFALGTSTTRRIGFFGGASAATEIGSVTNGGLWTLGQSGSSSIHQVNGTLSVVGNEASNAGELKLQNTGASGGTWRIGDGIAASNGSLSIYSATTSTLAMKIKNDAAIVLINGPAIFTVTAATGTTACTALCGSEPASLNSTSGQCLGAWNSTSGAALSTNGSSACTDTSNVARRCLCGGLE